jgi:hypothetical protein
VETGQNKSERGGESHLKRRGLGERARELGADFTSSFGAKESEVCIDLTPHSGSDTST